METILRTERGNTHEMNIPCVWKYKKIFPRDYTFVTNAVILLVTNVLSWDVRRLKEKSTTKPNAGTTRGNKRGRRKLVIRVQRI